MKRNTIQLHGILHHTFHHAVGWELMRVAYRPRRKTYFTRVLWALTAWLLGSFVLAFWSSTAVDWLFFLNAGLVIPYFMLAEYCIQRGLREEFSTDYILATLRQQPTRLRRLIMQFAFFVKSLEKQGIAPSTDELDHCLTFIESNRKDRPPGWTSYFRHPLVILIFGILVYAVNTQINIAPKTGDRLLYLTNIGSVVVALLYLGGMLYVARYSGMNTEWRFECCVRWYRLYRQDTSESFDTSLVKKVAGSDCDI